MKCFVSRAMSTALCAGLVLALAVPLAQAQTKPKKAGAAGSQKTLNGGAAKGNNLSFKEFEICLKEQDALKARTPDLQQQRDAMDAERKTILQEGEAIKAQGETMSKYSASVKDYNARLIAQGEKVKAWRARDEAIAAANRKGSAGDQERKQLEADRQELQKTEVAQDDEGKALKAERERLNVDAFNASVKAHEQAVTDWNARKKAQDALIQAYDDDQTEWASRCANRSYLEAWEKILRKEAK